MKTVSLIAALTILANVALAEPVAIVGGTVHTVGPQGTIDNATVLIDGERIIAVGEDVDVDVADGVRVIDASGKIVTPGLFTPTGTLGLVEVGFSAGPLDSVQRGNEFTASFDVADGFNPRSTLIAINRIEGVTRSLIVPRSAGADGNGNVSHVISGLAAVVNLGGTDNSIDRRGAAMVVNLGESGASLAGTSRVTALMILRSALAEAQDFREHSDAFERGQHRDYAFSANDLDALQHVLDGSVPLLVSVDRASDIAGLIELAREFRVRAIVNGGAEAWMQAEQLAAARIPVIVRPADNLPGNFDQLNARSDAVKLLLDAGVTLVFSDGDSHTHNARNITQSAGNATVVGVSREDALRAITLTPAEVFGVANRLGSIEVGKQADIVIWPGDPLELTNYPEQVLINGVEIEMSSRQTLLRDRYLDTASKTPPAYR